MAHASDVPGEAGPAIDLLRFDGAAFDLDGVVTRTASVHAAAWKRMFDAFLQRQSGAATPFRPFDIHADYLAYVDGKPRYDGVRDFLASRGIVLPEGAPDDPPDRDTVCGLGNRKNALFREGLAADGAEVFPESVTFLARLREAGLRLAVVSASENAADILASAGLSGLFDARVDGIEAARLRLKGKPAPDTFVHAARLLGVAPQRAFGVEDALAGVQAIRAAGFGLVLGVDRGQQAAALRAHGAELVVPDLGSVRLLHVAERRNRPGSADTAFAMALPATAETDPAWRLCEEGFVLAREHEIESLFAIGNGYVGTRGSLVEGSRLSSPATFVAGVFDGGASRGLMPAPDWTHLEVGIEGQALSLETGRNLEHRRILDLRQAILFREWRHQDDAGRITRVGGFRLASLDDRHLLLQSIAFSPENYSATVSLRATLADASSQRSASGTTIALAAAMRLSPLAGPMPAGDALDPAQPLRLEIGHVYRLDRVVAVHDSRDGADAQALARAHAARASSQSLPVLVERHVRAWARAWEACDLRIDGDEAAQRAVRFAMYHLLSAANPQDDRASIAARGLTGTAYQGHVFWDTEIFMLPFFTLTCPRAARAMLQYRHRTLPAARRRAAAAGHAGAWYAWESADTGDDVTPPFVTQPDGELTRVLTGEQEQHISADVAYAAWQYWRATGDRDFLLDAGAELLLETARFWASRATPGPDGRHHILGVIGPDEYHEAVDDNAYTNGMARWNLGVGERVARLLASQWPERWEALSARIGLDPHEPAAWSAVAGTLHTGLDARTGLIEQFRGYFALEDIDLAAYATRTAPMDVLLGRERLQGSQIIKQADVLMLLYLQWDSFPPPVREANFRYYEPRCAHGSSLSPAIHALLAARLGDTALAQRYFRQAMEIDLADNMGNAAGGVHAAALGGLWQAVVMGFAGVELGDDGPTLHPHLPAGWQRLSLRLQWQGRVHELDASPIAGGAPSAGGRT